MAAGCMRLVVGTVHLGRIDRGNHSEDQLVDILAVRTAEVELGRRMVLVDRVGSRLQPVVRKSLEAGHIAAGEEASKDRYLGMEKADHIVVVEAGRTGVEEGHHHIGVVAAGSQIGCCTEGTGYCPKVRS
jgi:hypothetical protein